MALSRRHLLRAAVAGAVLSAGCTGAEPSRTDQPTGTAVGTADTTVQAPCERAFGDREGTDECSGVRFESVGTEPVSTATTAPGETPYEGTFSDRLAVTVRTAGEPVAVRGCVVGTVDGSTTRRSVARTLPAEDTTHEFTVGPFDHPGGISSYHLWIRGCDASVRRE